MTTIIDQQYISGNSLVDYLKSQQELTFSNEAENNFRKTILLSSASFFEKEISDTVIDFAKSHTANNELVISIIKQKAVSRQYHTYFSWDSSNANTFFSLFGEEFKKSMMQKVKDDEKLSDAIKSFLEIGRERNRMVHQNFAEVMIEKTAEEIYKLYKSSLYFIETVKKELIKTEEEI
ncbi:hypothetical protein CMU21_08200 [Elizabethkingia anophelis]|nr:hypothetical protein [Elizabethkingia anophelis]